MDKPKGTFECAACGRKWDGSKLLYDPMAGYTCGSLTCGGKVQKISDNPKI